MTIAIWKNFIFTGSYDGIINKWNLNLGSKNRALLLNAQSNLKLFFFVLWKATQLICTTTFSSMYGQQKKCPKKFTHMSWLFSATIEKLLYGDPRSSLDNNVFIVKSVGTFFFSYQYMLKSVVSCAFILHFLQIKDTKKARKCKKS